MMTSGEIIWKARSAIIQSPLPRKLKRENA